MKIKKYSTPHSFKDRKGYVPDMIVLHNTGNTRISSAHYWFLDPDSFVSAHFLVGLDGEIRQYVDLKDGAFCNGTSQSKTQKSYYRNALSPLVASRPHNCNYYTVAIECVGNCGDGLTKEQLVAVAELIKHINKELKRLYSAAVPLDSEHIVRHCDINPKNKSTCGKNISVAEIITRIKKDAEPPAVRPAKPLKPLKPRPVCNQTDRKAIIKEN